MGKTLCATEPRGAWKGIAAIVAAVLTVVAGSVGTGCSNLKCGPGTVESRGKCVPEATDGSVLDGSTDGAQDDAGPTHVTVDDLSESRGTPVVMNDRGILDGHLFGVQPERVIMTDPQCRLPFLDSDVCDFRWVDDAGTTTAAMAHALPPATRFLTADGRHMVLLSNVEIACVSSQQDDIYSGSPQLLDAATGATSWSRAGVYTVRQGDSIFSSRDHWFRAPVEQSDPCVEPDPSFLGVNEMRRVSTPSLVVPSDTPLSPVAELSDGRFLAMETGGDQPRLVVADLLHPATTTVLADPAYTQQLLRNTDAAIHMSFRAVSGSTERIHLLYDPVEEVAYRYVPPEGGTASKVDGRFVVYCVPQTGQPVRICTTHDMKGDYADVQLTVLGDSNVLSLDGPSGSLYFIGLADPSDDLESVVYLDLTTGSRTVLRPDGGELVDLPGRPHALLLDTAARLWLLEPQGPQLLIEHVAQIFGPPEPGTVRALSPEAGSRPVLIISQQTLLDFRLSAWHDPEGRLVHLTNHLYYDSAQDSSFFHCARPHVPFSLGTIPMEGQIFFAELSADGSVVQMLLVPSDLSEPPREVGQTDTDNCLPPWVAPDGSRVAVYHWTYGEPQGHLYVGDL